MQFQVVHTLGAVAIHALATSGSSALVSTKKLCVIERGVGDEGVARMVLGQLLGVTQEPAIDYSNAEVVVLDSLSALEQWLIGDTLKLTDDTETAANLVDRVMLAVRDNLPPEEGGTRTGQYL